MHLKVTFKVHNTIVNQFKKKDLLIVTIEINLSMLLNNRLSKMTCGQFAWALV